MSTVRRVLRRGEEGSKGSVLVEGKKESVVLDENRGSRKK